MNRKHTSFIQKIFTLVLAAGLLLPSGLGYAAAPPEPPLPDNATLEAAGLPAELQGLMAAPKPYPKLDSALADLLDVARSSPSQALELAKRQEISTSGERMQVQISTRAAAMSEAVQAVVEAGGEVTGVGFDDTLIQAWLPIPALEALATNPDIDFIQPPTRAYLEESPLVGGATTEGLAAMNADAWHAAGISGSGVKIAIIDAGFQGYTALKGSDLPASITVKNFVDGEDDTQVDGTTKHGTACAEIAYDIAPQAQFFLAKINTKLDVYEAVAWLRDTHHVDVISTSFSFFNVTPGDGTGEFAVLTQSARDAGILWAKSSGNYRENHWGGAYYDNDNDNVHEFNGSGQEINYFVTSGGSPYSIPSGNVFRVYLRWSDWTNVDQDYDLYLLRWNTSSSAWEIMNSSYWAGGRNTQNGGAGQTPTESATGVSYSSSTAYGFMIQRKSGNRAVNFEVLAPSFPPLDELLHARSMADMGDAPAVMTVAALDVNPPYPQESYSSEGPTNGPGGIATGGAIKPDISGYANVATISYGMTNKFNGTSSATPHVAGAAGLVMSAFPAYTPAQVQTFLEGRAVDKGAAGKDPVYGYGQLHLGTPPGPPAGKTWNGSQSSDWHTAGNWTPSGVPAAGDDVNIPDTSRDPVISSQDAIARDLSIQTGAILNLTTRKLSVEGTLTNNGTLKQTKGVQEGSTTRFLEITNQSGSTIKYYGLEITPSDILPLAARSDEPDSIAARAWRQLSDWFGELFSAIRQQFISLRASLSKLPAPEEPAALGSAGAPARAVVLQLPAAANAGVRETGYRHEVQSRVQAALLAQAATPEPPDPSQQAALRIDRLQLAPPRYGSAIFPRAPDAAVSLTLDDGAHETAYGVNNSTNASQFIWLNRFTPNPGEFPFNLEEIRVMFDDIGGGANIAAGDAIDLVVYEDADGDPTNGATYRATYNVTVQYVDGTTWSVYSLPTPLLINGPGDVLIAAISRYVNSGVTLRTWPATIDTTIGQNRSWIGWWHTDPPNPALLPPDNTFELMTGADPGNWMIRGYGQTSGSPPTTTPTPTGMPTVTPTATQPAGATQTPTATPTSSPSIASVVVSISGNQRCSGRNSGVRRCYDITPDKAMTANVRFYFTESERSSLNKADLLLFHYGTSWEELAVSLTNGGSGMGHYVSAAGLSGFSLYALDLQGGGWAGSLFLPWVNKNFPKPPPPTPTPTTPPPTPVPTTPPTGIQPGYWKDSSNGTEFYVTSDSAHVDNFAIRLSISGCGTIKITHTKDEPISNNQFSFSGSYYASGTFDSYSAAHGTTGLNKFYIPTCGTVTGGPWSWNATWQHASQTNVPVIELQVEDFDPALDYFQVESRR